MRLGEIFEYNVSNVNTMKHARSCIIAFDHKYLCAPVVKSKNQRTAQFN